jgi:hypothetical protein
MASCLDTIMKLWVQNVRNYLHQLKDFNKSFLHCRMTVLVGHKVRAIKLKPRIISLVKVVKQLSNDVLRSVLTELYQGCLCMYVCMYVCTYVCT